MRYLPLKKKEETTEKLEEKSLTKRLSDIGKGVAIGIGISACVATLAYYGLKNYIQPTTPITKPTPIVYETPALVEELYHTPTLIPTSTKLPTLEPIKYVAGDPWKVNRVSHSSVDKERLLPGDVLYLSASHFKVGPASCDNQYREDFLCVYVHQATEEEIVRIENIIPDCTWIGVTDRFGIQEAIDNNRPYWWTNNCGVNGCKTVQVVVRYADGSVSVLPQITR